jgi:uncharacterized protein
MSSKPFLFWLLVIGFFMLWTLRVLYLPSPQSDTFAGLLTNTSLRLVFFFCPFLLAVVFLFRERLREAFAVTKSTLIGWVLAGVYSLIIVLSEFLLHAVTPPANPWLLINFPIAPVIEELVFRGFIFTKLLSITGRVQTILISSVLFTFIHFPGWIFTSQLKGENFIVITGQVFLFSLFQGVIRLYAGSVLPNIVVHVISNFFAFATE